MTGVQIRKAVRAFLIDPDDQLLMLRVRLPDDGPVWVAPGDGIQPRASPEQALRRERSKELGLDRLDLGPAL